MRIWPRHGLTALGILRGIEANIKDISGEIDCSGKMFDSLDLIIAGFHGPFLRQPHDKETNTRAMIDHRQRQVHIISHPEIQSIQWRLRNYHRAGGGEGTM